MEGGLVHHIPVNWLGMQFNLDTIIYTWLTMAVMLVFAWAGARRLEMVPTGAQNLFEGLVEYVESMTDEMIGPEGRKVAPYLFTLFLFLTLANLWGLVPKMTSPTNDLNTNLGLALISTVGVYFIGVWRKGPGYFKHFLEPLWFMLPLNILDELIRPLTLALRLFVNILVGEVLLMVLNQIVPIGIPVFWLMRSVLIGLIQAFVFTLLSTVYLASALSNDH